MPKRSFQDPLCNIKQMQNIQSAKSKMAKCKCTISLFIYLLAVVFLWVFILIFIVIIVSFSIRDNSVGDNDRGPTETLGVDIQLPGPGLETSHVAGHQLLPPHQHQPDKTTANKNRALRLCIGRCLPAQMYKNLYSHTCV